MNRPPFESIASAEDPFSYSLAEELFDEMQSEPGLPKPHWERLIASFRTLGPSELRARVEGGKRILKDHGVSYNHYGDPAGIERPWGLDIAPLILTEQDWKTIEEGMTQRCRLFNLIMADIYSGPQRLLRNGFIPPELVYANEGFLRACRGTKIKNQAFIHLQACDLGRSADGRWWVLSDRTEAPSGTGYAWENRTVISRLLPEEISETKVQRLNGFFQTQREMLFRLAPPQVENPTILLLTAGPANQTYFEDTYLARNLGFQLVEGEDLTVRGQHLFLKTIEGLQRVDVVVRRVDDWFCDPLELRQDSLLGVPGLVEVTRAGNVTLANALGSGLLESPAFLPFLPLLCRHLLHEDLKLPSIATWWCGQDEELAYVRENVDQLVLKPAFRPQAQLPLPVAKEHAGSASGPYIARTIKQVLNREPAHLVAQELINLSQAPVWVRDRFVPRPVVLRVFVVTDGLSFCVMPGGLTRVAESPTDFLVSVVTGQSSKDTWVLASESDTGDSASPTMPEMRIAEPLSLGIPSRAADHLYWLGRYTERLEQLLRVLRCVLGRLQGEAGNQTSIERSFLTELLANLNLSEVSSSVAAGNGNVSKIILQLMYDPKAPQGVRSLLQRIRWVASAVRDRFSGDTWRILGRLEVDSQARAGRLPLASATSLAHNLILDLAAFSGMEMENMTRGHGWRFLDAGRRLERGLSVLRVLQAATRCSNNFPQAVILEPVLEMADSVMTYRRQHFDAPRFSEVCELLIRDRSNPRSLAFQVDSLSQHASALKADLGNASLDPEEDLLRGLKENIENTDFVSFSEQVANDVTVPLLELLDQAVTSLAQLSDQLTRHFFSHTFPQTSR